MTIAVALWGCASGHEGRTGAPRAAAIVDSIDRLALVRDAADREALYTLAGGLKPMSSGFWRGSFAVGEPDLAVMRRVRAALATLRNDDWYADVQVFASMHDGERAAHAYVVHRDALAAMIDRHATFWSPWGITSGTHPSEVVAVVDRMPKADRWRGYGYLFGYPDDAVDFFVAAGLTGDDSGEVGPGKDRSFIHIPTHGSEQGRFVYAVPLGHVETEADRRLAREAARILAAYSERRDRLDDAASLIRELRRLNRRFEAEVRSSLGGDVVGPPSGR